MVKYIFFISLIIICKLIQNVKTQCDENIFIFITKTNIFLLNFDISNDYSSNIIYQTKINTTIDYGLYHKRTNTIILLINNKFNKNYSIITLNPFNNIYKNWIENFNKLIYSSPIYISYSQKYFYLLNSQTYLLQIFKFPLTSIIYKQNNLLNLPINQNIIHYLIDENFQFLWILFENIQYQLYICYLNTYTCQLYMNIFNINKPIQFIINWNLKQFYLYSNHYLIVFEYNFNQTNYSINYLDFNHKKYLTICEKTNFIEYITINQQQICFDACQNIPILNETNYIHTIERLSSISSIFYCSKQRQISKIIIMILILIDLIGTLGLLLWLAYKFFYKTILDNNEKQMDNGMIWTSQKEFITHF